MIYKVGSRGNEVVKIQKAVGVSADGVYGARTKEAVAVWQKSHGLTSDGIVGLLNALPQSDKGYSFQIGSGNIAKLSDEQKAIATNKGWTLI